MRKTHFATALLALSLGVVQAQEGISLELNGAPAEVFFREIEQQSGYRIYAPQETDTLRFSVRCTDELPGAVLQKAFEGTPFRVSVYRNQYIFILRDKELTTLLPEDYFRETPRAWREEGGEAEPKEQKATSENKIYTVGREGREDAPDTVTLSGIIRDFSAGNPVAGAVIYTEKDRIATATDANGAYTLRFPAGRQNLHIRGIGLKNTRRQVAVYESGVLDIEIEEEVYALQEVSVSAERMDGVQNTIPGMERIRIKDIKNIPVAFGETDVIKVVMMLPGVKSVGEASGGINVRGGSTDQNLILFNDGTIYNPTHLFGFFAAFNPDLIKDAELYKSSIPAKYGGRISSVLDINGREGSKEKFAGSASLGLLTSSLTLEGPAGKNTSYILGGRTTYSDWMLGLLPENSGYRNGSAGFYDLNLIVDHRMGERDNLYLSGYYSYDRFNFDAGEQYRYANTNASAKWRHLFGERLSGTLTGGYDSYGYESADQSNPTAAYLLSFDIRQVFGKLDFTAYLNDKHTLDFGAGSIYYSLHPGTYLPFGEESLVTADRIATETASESSVYVADRWDVTPELSLNAGVRYSLFRTPGRVYQAPDFRLSLRYAFTPDFSLKAGLNTLQQNIHKLSDTAIMSPTDTWKLSDVNIRPQRGLQVAAGMYGNFLPNAIEASAEVYYKGIRNYLDYRSGARLVMNHHIETDVVGTEGRAYGIELMLKKPQGKLNGWASYSYSRAQLKQAGWYRRLRQAP